MDKTYNAQQLEKNCYEHWESQGYFKPQPADKAYCIMLPPPNVTGTLHMGHGFQQAIMDALIRFHRMQGEETLWQVGTDHAGIATQMVVERQLLQQNLSRHDLGREGFLKKVWEWKEESGQTILQQMRRLGVSADWSRSRFTMDDDMSAAVRDVFIRLFDEGLIYQGKRLVNWDPTLGTAVSDLEVNTCEEQGALWHIRYPLVGSDTYLTVATTRPETLLGDVAVAVHPDDERYAKWIGHTLHLPLTDRNIPIIADEYVDPTFGSGCVKITPAHDFNDYAIGQRHGLTLINILNPDATLNENVPEAYRGLNRFVAREKIIADLTTAGLLEKTQPHTLMIPRGDRSGDVLEPFLTTQWYVKTKSLADPAIAAVQSGEIRFVPENWSKTYFQWMHNIEDWCISRQLWWGHRIPAWYDCEGHVYVAADEASVRTKYALTDDCVLTQDPDVLDTWFSSALWPFSTLGWPENTPDLQTFYPTQVLVTGFDIIFFWVARMIMFGLKFTGHIPFKEVYITGLIRDQDGQKMSKSKGNVLDPIDLIDGIDLETLVHKRTAGLMQPAMAERIAKNTRAQFPEGIGSYGTDALRMTFYSLSSPGRELRFEMNRLENYHHFCHKLGHAARFVSMKITGQPRATAAALTEANLADRWILAKVQQAIVEVTEQIRLYRFDLAVQTLYEFTWQHYCDWYVELSKITTQADQPCSVQAATRYTLVHVLDQLLRLLHPFIPFITETLWQPLKPFLDHSNLPDSIMLATYPTAEATWVDSGIITAMDEVQAIILAIRQIRGEMNINPGKPLPLLLRTQDKNHRQRFETAAPYILSLAKLSNVSWLTETEEPPASATAVIGDLHLFIPLAGLIDVHAETARLSKEITKLSAEIQKCEHKLNNAAFVEKAPVAVIEQEKTRLADFSTQVHGLMAQRDRLLDTVTQ